MTTIDKDSPDTTFDAVWNGLKPPVTDSNDLPEALAVESEKHYGEINIRPYFAKLAMEQEKLRDGKILMKNDEMRELRNRLSTITDFLDKANYELMRTQGNKIQMVGPDYADMLLEIKKILPEHARNLIGDKSTFDRREIEHLCQVLTRKIDSDITPQIDELKDEIFDIMQLLDKILPTLKELLKRYDDHINYILRQPR